MPAPFMYLICHLVEHKLSSTILNFSNNPDMQHNDSVVNHIHYCNG